MQQTVAISIKPISTTNYHLLAKSIATKVTQPTCTFTPMGEGPLPMQWPLTMTEQFSTRLLMCWISPTVAYPQLYYGEHYPVITWGYGNNEDRTPLRIIGDDTLSVREDPALNGFLDLIEVPLKPPKDRHRLQLHLGQLRHMIQASPTTRWSPFMCTVQVNIINVPPSSQFRLECAVFEDDNLMLAMFPTLHRPRFVEKDLDALIDSNSDETQWLWTIGTEMTMSWAARGARQIPQPWPMTMEPSNSERSVQNLPPLLQSIQAMCLNW